MHLTMKKCGLNFKGGSVSMLKRLQALTTHSASLSTCLLIQSKIWKAICKDSMMLPMSIGLLLSPISVYSAKAAMCCFRISLALTGSGLILQVAKSKTWVRQNGMLWSYRHITRLTAKWVPKIPLTIRQRLCTSTGGTALSRCCSENSSKKWRLLCPNALTATKQRVMCTTMACSLAVVMILKILKLTKWSLCCYLSLRHFPPTAYLNLR